VVRERKVRNREGVKGERLRKRGERENLFEKGMTGALAPFSYLVLYSTGS